MGWRFLNHFLLPQQTFTSVCIVNFEHISHLFFVFLLLTLNKQMLAGTGLFSYPLKALENLQFSIKDPVIHLWWSFFDNDL